MELMVSFTSLVEKINRDIFLWQRKRKLSYVCRTVILKFYFDLVEHLDAMSLYLKQHEDFLEHRLNCWKNVRSEKINMVVHIVSFYQKISNLMFFWPCIMNWLYINYQLDALTIIYS